MRRLGLPEWLWARREAWMAEHPSEKRWMFMANSGLALMYRASRDRDDRRETNLLRDVAFNRHSMNDGHHISPLDNGTVQVGTDGIHVKIVQGIDVPALKRTLSMATRATIGLDVSAPMPGDWEPCEEFREMWKRSNGRIEVGRESYRLPEAGEYPNLGCAHSEHQYRSGMAAPKADGANWQGMGSAWLGQVPGDDWEEMLKGGLQTALETQTIVLAVSGVSRTCTHQLVRSRKAAFHQQSQRASYYGDRPETRMPESIWRNPRARASFLAAIEASHNAYRVACEEDISYQDARYGLLEGTDNYILLEYTIREFLNVFAYRGCSMFSWEIVHVMREARRLLVAEYPWLEPYIKISCEKTNGSKDAPPGLAIPEDYDNDEYAHTCMFQGWERVEGQCDFPWARDSNRSFRSEAHEIGGRKKLGVTIVNDPPLSPPPIQEHLRPPSERGQGPTMVSPETLDKWVEAGRESLRRHHPTLAEEIERTEQRNESDDRQQEGL